MASPARTAGEELAGAAAAQDAEAAGAPDIEGGAPAPDPPADLPVALQIDQDMVRWRAQDAEDTLLERALFLTAAARAVHCRSAENAQRACHLATAGGATPTAESAAEARLTLHIGAIVTHYPHLAAAFREVEAMARTLLVYRLNPLARRTEQELARAWRAAHAPFAERMAAHHWEDEFRAFRTAHEQVIEDMVGQPPGI